MNAPTRRALTRTLRSACAAALLLALPLAPPARGEDAEQATHAADAAVPQVSFEAKGEGWVLRQYQLGCLSQLTYLVGSKGEAAVVDPQRDVEHYLRDAKALGLEIRHVVLTHTNADFVAGHTELAARTGAKVHISAESGSKFPHEARRDGDRVAVGGLTLEFWATPGHTLDAMTVLVRAPGATPDPAFALTGDTLFIGGIGRPDLVGGDVTPMLLAGKAWDSVRRLAALPDGTQVLPAHGAGSLCGAHLSPETVSTVGRERATNPYLTITSRAQFVAKVASDLPPAPPYFRHNVALNRAGPPIVDPAAAPPAALDPAAVKTAAAAGAWIVDVRDAKEYAAGHVEGAVNVALRGRLDTWTGSVVPFGADLILAGSDEEAREAAFRLRRIGYDRVAGRLSGGPDAWRAAGLRVRTSRVVTPADLAAAMKAGTEPVLVDVRTPGEVEELRIGDYANVPVTDFERFGAVLDRTQPVLMVCNSAYRSSMAVGLAERQGFADVASLEGGLDAWITAGLPVIGTAQAAVCPAPAGAAPSTPVAGAPADDTLVLPEKIEPAALAEGLLDQPSAWAVIDVRPAWQFAEYHVPGAVNVALGALPAHVAGLAPGMRVVLVDRDGTQAFAAAGWLAARSGGARPVRVLAGGTERFWREIETVRGTGGAAAPAAPQSSQPPQPGPSPTAPPAPTPAPKKRSAGC